MDEWKPPSPIPQLKIRNEITSKHSNNAITTNTVNVKIEPNEKVFFEIETSEAPFEIENTNWIKNEIKSEIKQELSEYPEMSSINFSDSVAPNIKVVEPKEVEQNNKWHKCTKRQALRE